ncbi:MAG: hypothetical protein AB1716_25025, partial [Planctomycetota bacterium]
MLKQHYRISKAAAYAVDRIVDGIRRKVDYHPPDRLSVVNRALTWLGEQSPETMWFVTQWPDYRHAHPDIIPECRGELRGEPDMNLSLDHPTEAKRLLSHILVLASNLEPAALEQLYDHVSHLLFTSAVEAQPA